MNKQHQPKAPKGRVDSFYEVLPYSHGLPYDHHAKTEEPVDKDLDSIQDEGRAVAIKTLAFVALTTLIICILLVWGVETARQTLPATR